MSNLKPIVALFKAYRGGEWFQASLKSIHEACAGAVVVLSDRPWAGSPSLTNNSYLPENCRSPLAQFKADHPDFRIEEVTAPTPTNTEEQYRIGMDAIRSKFGGTYGVLLIDTDELWDTEALLVLRRAMSSSSALCFRAGIWTYVRSPLWRVYPQEAARVSVALASPGQPTGRSRLANIHQVYRRDQIVDVACSYHHIGYVRNDPEEITAKLINNDTQDKVGFRPLWMRTVWDLLPAGRNIHPQTRFEHCWQGVREVDARQLPKAMTNSPAFWAGLKWHVGQPNKANTQFLDELLAQADSTGDDNTCP